MALVGQASFADGPKLAESVAAYVRNKAGSARILPLARRGNIFGSLDMGLAPDLLPGRVADEEAGRTALATSWGDMPVERGKDTRSMLEGLDLGEIRFLRLVGADPVRDVPDPRQAALGLESAEYVVSIDLFLNDSNRDADVIFPAAGFAEKEGTVTNLEGRVQKVNVIAPVPGQARPDWEILNDLAERAGRPIGLSNGEAIAKDIVTKTIREQVVTQLSLPADQEMQVEVASPVIPQLITGTLSEVTITSEDVPMESFVGDVTVSAQDIPIRGGGEMGSGTATVVMLFRWSSRNSASASPSRRRSWPTA